MPRVACSRIGCRLKGGERGGMRCWSSSSVRVKGGRHWAVQPVMGELLAGVVLEAGSGQGS